MRSRRCSTSTIRASQGEWVPNQLRRQREPRRDRLPAQDERGRPTATRPGDDHGGRGIDRLARRLAPDLQRRPRLRLQVEHGLDARHAALHAAGSDPPPLPPPQPDLRAALRLLGEFHPAALPRRGGARQGLAARQDAGRPLAEIREPARLFRLHVGASRQEAAVHGRRVRPGAGVEPRHQPRLAPAGRSPAQGRQGRWSATSTGSTSSTPALYSRDVEHTGFQWLVADDQDNSVIAWARKGAKPGEVAIVVSNFTPVPREDYRIGVPQAGFYREAFNSDAGDLRRLERRQPGRASTPTRRRATARGRACRSPCRRWPR